MQSLVGGIDIAAAHRWRGVVAGWKMISDSDFRACLRVLFEKTFDSIRGPYWKLTHSLLRRRWKRVNTGEPAHSGSCCVDDLVDQRPLLPRLTVAQHRMLPCALAAEVEKRKLSLRQAGPWLC